MGEMQELSQVNKVLLLLIGLSIKIKQQGTSHLRCMNVSIITKLSTVTLRKRSPKHQIRNLNSNFPIVA